MPSAQETLTPDLTDLARFGMRRVARIELVGPTTVTTTLEETEAGNWTYAIYAIVFNGIITRIGSSKGKLKDRCRQTDRYVTNYMTGKYTPHNAEELAIWKECFSRYGVGTVHACISPKITTVFGEYHDYLSSESYLLGRYRPRLNMSHHR